MPFVIGLLNGYINLQLDFEQFELITNSTDLARYVPHLHSGMGDFPTGKIKTVSNAAVHLHFPILLSSTL